MKNLNIILFLYLVSCISLNSYSQNEEIQSEITTYARYTNTQGIELRIIPDKQYVLTLGIKDGFVVERAAINSTNFKQIGEVKAFSDSEWQKLIDSETDTEAKKQIQMAKFFYDGIGKNNSKKINFSNGIKDLVDQKSGEEFTFMIFLFSALKNAHIAEALGMAYFDSTAIKGNTYQYRVKLKKSTRLYKILNPVFTVSAIEEHKNYKNYFYSKQGDTNISFFWEDIPTLHGFDIERADFNSATFIKLNNAPIYSLTNVEESKTPNGYIDKGLINYKKYTYRFYAHSIFGERIKLFEMTTNPIDLTPPPIPKMFKPNHKNPKEVLISWEIKGIPKDFKGFAVARSSKNRGKFKVLHAKLLPKGTKQFIDKSFNKDKMNYYIVQAIDTANNVSSTVPYAVVLIDSIPPKKPIIKSIKVDSLGLVNITVELNKEKDLMGYRIYRANSDKHEFSAIQDSFVDLDSVSTKVKTVFKDTVSLNSLTKNIFYRVKALDFNYNQSNYSDIYVVTRPDTIAPSTPVFKKIKTFENKIELHFALSTSRDVKIHYIYRKTLLTDTWKQLAQLKNTDTNFIDNQVQKGITYYYSIRALDESNLYSDYATVVYTTLINKGVLPEITNFKITDNNGVAKLIWEYTVKDSDTFFIIYRKNPKGKLKQYKRTDKLFFDDKLTVNGTYTYAIRAINKKGEQSTLTEKTDVKK